MESRVSLARHSIITIIIHLHFIALYTNKYVTHAHTIHIHIHTRHSSRPQVGEGADDAILGIFDSVAFTMADAKEEEEVEKLLNNKEEAFFKPLRKSC